MPVISLQWNKTEKFEVIGPKGSFLEEKPFRHPIFVWQGEISSPETPIFMFEVNPEELSGDVSPEAEPVKTAGRYSVQSWGTGIYTLSLSGNIGPIFCFDKGNLFRRQKIWEQIRNLEKWATQSADEFSPNMRLFYPYGLHSDRTYKGYFSNFKLNEVAETYNVYALTSEFRAVEILPTTWKVVI